MPGAGAAQRRRRAWPHAMLSAADNDLLCRVEGDAPMGRLMRAIEPVLIRVGQSFRASTWQMVVRIYLPAMREPIVNGARLGLGVAIIGTLLAETKLSNRGLGYLVIQAYSLFDMPKMYALLLVLFTLAIGANALIDRTSRLQSRRPGW